VDRGTMGLDAHGALSSLDSQKQAVTFRNSVSNPPPPKRLVFSNNWNSPNSLVAMHVAGRSHNSAKCIHLHSSGTPRQLRTQLKSPKSDAHLGSRSGSSNKRDGRIQARSSTESPPQKSVIP
jgi:hypothetical protein